MTRVLVCGAAVLDDPSFIHNSLNEVHRTYGPIACVIHSNHLPAMMWQQWAARKHSVTHLPVVPDPKDGTARLERCRDRMFDHGRPTMVVVFESTADKADLAPVSDALGGRRFTAAELITHRAGERGIPVITYTYDPITARAHRAAARLEARAVKQAQAAEREEARAAKLAARAAKALMQQSGAAL